MLYSNNLVEVMTRLSMQAFNMDRAALAATILAKQLEAQPPLGFPQLAQDALEQSPAQPAAHPNSPDRSDAKAVSSKEAAGVYDGPDGLPAEISTELMWQSDSMPHLALEPAVEQSPERQAPQMQQSQLESHSQTEPQSESQSQLETALEQLEHVYQSNPQIQLQLRSKSPVKQGMVPTAQLPLGNSNKLSSEGELLDPSGHKMHEQHHLPRLACDSPEGYRDTLAGSWAAEVPFSLQQQHAESTMPVRDPAMTDPSLELPESDSQDQLSVDQESSGSIQQHDSAENLCAQEEQCAQMAPAEHQATGRSTLVGSPQDLAPPALHVPSSITGTLNEAATGHAAHFHGRKPASQAGAGVRSWSTQQLRLEDSSEAVAAGAKTVAGQGTDKHGCAVPAVVSDQDEDVLAQHVPKQPATVRNARPGKYLAEQGENVFRPFCMHQWSYA